MVKKGVIIFLIGFGLYYLFSQPEGAAEAVRDTFNGVLEAFGQLGIFFRELT